MFQSYSHLSEFLIIPSSFQLEISVHPYIHTNLSGGYSSSYVMSFCRIESTRHMRKTWVLHGFADFCCLKFVPVLVGAFKIQLLHLPSILFSLIKPSKGVRFMGRYTPPSNWDPTGICKEKPYKRMGKKKTSPESDCRENKSHFPTAWWIRNPKQPAGMGAKTM